MQWSGAGLSGSNTPSPPIHLPLTSWRPFMSHFLWQPLEGSLRLILMDFFFFLQMHRAVVGDRQPHHGCPGSLFWFSALPYYPCLQPRACQGSTLTLLRCSLCQGPDGGSRHIPLCSLPSWTLGNTDETTNSRTSLLCSGLAPFPQQPGSGSRAGLLSWVLTARDRD